MAPPRSRSADDGGENVRDRIIRVAHELICETGDFNFSMRDLAARARVSLRTPYDHFGGKSAIITAILHRDQAQHRPLMQRMANRDLAEVFFENLGIGVEFLADRQPFYRALFRAAQIYSGGDETEAARENQALLTAWCRRASQAGLFEAFVDPDIAGGTLTDIVAAEYRHWANSGFDIRLAGLRIGFGYAAVLAGLGTEPFAGRMRAKAAGFHQALADYVEPGRPAAAALGPKIP